MNSSLCIYNSDIRCDEEFTTSLTKIANTHLIVYNYVLESSVGKNLSVKEKIKLATDYLKANNITTYILDCLKVEIYYLDKKLNRGNFKPKLLSDISYLTFTKENSIRIDSKTLELKIPRTQGKAFLCLPVTEEILLSRKYVNISYSPNEQKFELKIFN